MEGGTLYLVIALFVCLVLAGVVLLVAYVALYLFLAFAVLGLVVVIVARLSSTPEEREEMRRKYLSDE